MNTKPFRKWKEVAVASALIGVAGLCPAAEDVDDALKGRDLNTIMKLLQAEGEAETPAVAAPVAPEAPAVVPQEEPPVAPAPVTPPPAPAPVVVKEEPLPVRPAEVKITPPPPAHVTVDSKSLSNSELDAFRAQLAREMDAAKADQEAKAELITKQADAVRAISDAPPAQERIKIPAVSLAAAPAAAAPVAAPKVAQAEVPAPAPIEKPSASEPVVTKTVQAPKPSPAPVELAQVEPKKRGFFQRIFGSDDDDAKEKAAVEKSAPVRVPSVKVSAETKPARPDPVSDARPGVSADAMMKNRSALEGLLTSSREDVVKMAMGQASGDTTQVNADPDVDPDAWKKAGPNAWRYNGEWQGGSMHGQGRLVYADGWEYVGTWKAGAMDGQGTLVMPDGTKYEGQWQNGRMSGFGQLTYPDGWQFVGQWRDGRISGQGTLIHPGK